MKEEENLDVSSQLREMVLLLDSGLHIVFELLLISFFLSFSWTVIVQKVEIVRYAFCNIFGFKRSVK